MYSDRYHNNTYSFSITPYGNILLPRPIYFFFSTPSTSPFPQTLPSTDTNTWLAEDTPEFLRETAPFYQHLLGPPDRLHGETAHIARHIETNSALACSDGSYDPHFGTGTHSLVFSTTRKEILLQSAGPTGGHPIVNSPYRSEISGLLAVLYIPTKICRFHNIKTGSLTIICGNKGALWNIFSRTYSGISPFLYTDFDLLRHSHYFITCQLR